MKAAACTRYGPPDVVHITEVDKPLPKDNQALIRVRAAAVNPLDLLIRGTPYLLRIMFGLRRPKDPRLGRDVAGRIEAVGRNVTQFKPCDEVFGGCLGAFAEYACASESNLALKPDAVTFEQAAAVPVAALTALQGLRDKGQIQPGQKVLINGAAGGVGTFAVQVAKSFGADVTGVCSTRSVDMVRSLGADRVVDYTREDFTTSGERYDVIFDCVGNRPLFALNRLLTDKGKYVAIGAPPQGRWVGPLGRVFKTLLFSWFVSRKVVMFLAAIRTADLTIMGELMKAGKVTPVIDRCYTLRDLPQAIRHLGEGHARGKVVITVPE